MIRVECSQRAYKWFVAGNPIDSVQNGQRLLLYVPNRRHDRAVEIDRAHSVAAANALRILLCARQSKAAIRLYRVREGVTPSFQVDLVDSLLALERSFLSFVFQFAYEHGKGQPITFETIAKHCALPVGIPSTLDDLVQLENIFDVMDIYLWLSLRFGLVFSDGVRVRQAQAHIDRQIQESVNNILQLAREDEPSADQTGNGPTINIWHHTAAQTLQHNQIALDSFS